MEGLRSMVGMRISGDFIMLGPQAWRPGCVCCPVPRTPGQIGNIGTKMGASLDQQELHAGINRMQGDLVVS